MQQRILLLGGYGRAGAAIANVLLTHHPTAHISLAGRRPDAARKAASRLAAEHPDATVDAFPVDATNRTDLREAFNTCDLAVVAAPFRDNGPMVVETAADTGIDYIDISPDTAKTDAPERLEEPEFVDHLTTILTSILVEGSATGRP